MNFEKVSLKQFIADAETFTASQELYDAIKLPCRATKGSAGYDFFSPIDFSLEPGETIKFPTGIRCKLDDGHFLMIVPRSSLGFGYRLQLDNTVGIVDSDYYSSDNEGHIWMKLTNDCKYRTLYVKKGDAIAQGIILPYGLTDDDKTHEIRNGGLGSTTRK